MGIIKEIEILVFEKFPKSAGERKCAIERRMMDGLRDRYRKQLIDEQSEKARAKDAEVQKETEATRT
jgi:hypothetical protein